MLKGLRRIFGKMCRAALVSLLGCALALGVASLLAAQRPAAKDTQGQPQSDAGGVRSALSLVCPPGTTKKDATGCSACPPQASFSDSLGWELRASITGNFTGARESNMLLGGSGCEPHVAGFGGTFVFARDTSRLRLLRYDPGLIINKCDKQKLADGRDFLVCNGQDGGQGTWGHFVYMATFDPSGQHTTSIIFGTDDTTGTCGVDGKRVQAALIARITFSDLDGDGLPDLSIQAALGSKKFSEAEKQACMNGSPVPIPTRMYRLNFLFDGHDYRVAPSSEPIMKLFREP